MLNARADVRSGHYLTARPIAVYFFLPRAKSFFVHSVPCNRSFMCSWKLAGKTGAFDFEYVPSPRNYNSQRDVDNMDCFATEIYLPDAQYAVQSDEGSKQTRAFLSFTVAVHGGMCGL